MGRLDVREDDVKELLAQASPKLADAIASRRTIEIHIHLTGPVVVGTEVASSLLPVLLKATRNLPQQDK